MVESAALLVDEVLPKKPIRQGSAARLTLSRVVYSAEPCIGFGVRVKIQYCIFTLTPI
jgi:hypothetical protein